MDCSELKSMKKVLIVYSKSGNMEAYAQALKKGAESQGHLVTLKAADQSGDMLTCHPYDLVLVGSPAQGLFGGKIPADVKPFISSMKRLEGKETITFMKSRLIGADKAMRNLMNFMEAQGSLVKDFRSFRSTAEALAFGKTL